MACFSTTLGVLFLFGFFTLSANKETCDPAAVGQKKLTLPFDKKALSATDALKWTHNGTIIFHKQSGKVSIGKPEDVTATGDLQLYDLKFSDAGVYKADVHDQNETFVKGQTTLLCMIAPQPKPVVTFVCDSKANAVTLTCNVPQAQGLIFAWALNGKPLPSETGQTLKSSLKGVKNNDFACSAANKVGKESSISIRPTCPPEPPTCPTEPPPTLLCFKPKIVLVALAGAGSAILLLIITIIVLCRQHRRRKAVLSLGGRGQLRMSQLTPSDPVGPDYESMHPTEHSPPHSPKASPMYSTERSPPPSTKASPRAYTLAVPQPGPGAQASEKTPEFSTAAEGQKHSPVPKPRTKAPQTTGN